MKHRLYIVGHSQGGWIVQVALANYPTVFAGGISMAGPTFSVRK
jgi:predicted peptidase